MLSGCGTVSADFNIAEFEKDIPAVYEMLKEGCAKASEECDRTVAAVKHAMKIDYFDDKDLIAEQAARYSS